MTCSWHIMTHILTLASSLSLSFSVIHSALCREVIVPTSPLYRVAGFSLTLPCSVTGYEGPKTQNFEFFQYRSETGGHQIGVVSTQDPGFPYAPFQARVRSGEIRVERDSGDKARLVIQRLRPDDQGRFECYTPSTDSRYQGNYSASVVVKGKGNFCYMQILERYSSQIHSPTMTSSFKMPTQHSDSTVGFGCLFNIGLSRIEHMDSL